MYMNGLWNGNSEVLLPGFVQISTQYFCVVPIKLLDSNWCSHIIVLTRPLLFLILIYENQTLWGLNKIDFELREFILEVESEKKHGRNYCPKIKHQIVFKILRFPVVKYYNFILTNLQCQRKYTPRTGCCCSCYVVCFCRPWRRSLKSLHHIEICCTLRRRFSQLRKLTEDVFWERCVQFVRYL